MNSSVVPQPLSNVALAPPDGVPPELLSTVVEGSRKAGNEAFKGRNFRKAIEVSSGRCFGHHRERQESWGWGEGLGQS